MQPGRQYWKHWRSGVSGVRLTSPGLLLIFAIVAGGGIYLVDLFFLRPHVTSQEEAALCDQAAEVEQSVGLVLASQHNVLHRFCSDWVLRAKLKSLLRAGMSQKEFAAFAREAFAPAGIDLACIQDRSHRSVLTWPAASSSDMAILTLTHGPHRELPVQSTGERPLALVKSSAGAALVAQQAVVDESDRSKILGCLSVLRRLDSRLLAKAGKAIKGELTFVGSTWLPEVAPDNVVASRVYWPVVEDKLMVVWPVHDLRGKAVGYLRASVPVGHVYRQARAARRTVLIVLSLSVGLVLMVIMGVHILIAGPVVRLMRRLQQIEAGEAGKESLTNNLHGEPLVVARRLESAFDKLDRMSKTDQLTGLANRGHFHQMLGCSFEQARRYNRPLSVMVLDLDFFKAVNDAAGHQAGDDLLKSVASSISSACRKADLAARLGGDEFAILLPESTTADVCPVARRIRETIAQQVVRGRNLAVKVTISIGIADLNSGVVDSAGALVNLADRALYAAKELGRNRTILAHDLDGLTWPDSWQDEGKVDVLYKKLAGLDTEFKDLFIRAVEEVVEVLEERSPHMVDHARRARRYALLIAREMELPERLIKHLSGAAMLHDIGMLALPDSVLLSPSSLDEQQWKVVRRHPLIGARIMVGMEFLEQEIPSVRYHHERYDGKGYPEGLAGAEIPLPARILAVADAFVAMISSRAFRDAKTPEDALKELKDEAGKQFDPVVVEAFLAVAERLGDKLVAAPRTGKALKAAEQPVT